MDSKTPPEAWHIPRPSLSSAASSGRGRGGSASSQGSSSSNSTQSARSGSVLLSSARLPHMIIPENCDASWSHVTRGTNAGRTPSVASSTHFTLVNGYTKQGPAETGCCARSHHITVLVLTMTVLLSAAILAAICFVEMRMRKETGVYKYS